MKTEYEVRLLEIDHDLMIEKLEKLGAQKVFGAMQERKVYDFNPVDPNRWIRLRTNGLKTTLTIKELKDKTITGTKEAEIEVSSFIDTDEILNQLGYEARSYQQNFRIQYILDDVEIDLDRWPLIPEYMEIEGKSTDDVYAVLDKLGINKDAVTTMDVDSIYKYYGIDDICHMPKLLFKEEDEKCLKN